MRKTRKKRVIRLGICLFFLLFSFYLLSCNLASMKQIRAAVKDGYVAGYMQKGLNAAKIKKLSLQKKWQPYKLDCTSGKPLKIEGDVKLACRLGDALEQNFIQLLGSCGINWFKGKLTAIPKVLQNNLALRKDIKVFNGVSIFRLFRFVFEKQTLDEFTKHNTKTNRFLKRRVLGSNLHLSSARGYNSASYRQNCNSLVTAGLSLGINFSLVSLKSALKSQYSTQGFRELLVFQGLFTSPLHKALSLPDEDPNKWFTQFHIWMAHKRQVETRRKWPKKPLTYLKSLVGVAIFETQRSSRKTKLKASASAKGGFSFVSGSGKIKGKYANSQQFSFKGFSTLIFKQNNARTWDAEFTKLPTPMLIRDEFKAQDFPISPTLSFLVPNSTYRHELIVDGMPVQFCKRSTWKLIRCDKKYRDSLHRNIQRTHCGARKKRWVTKIQVENVFFTARSEQQPTPICHFKIRYKTTNPKGAKARYDLSYILVGRNQARIKRVALQIPHHSEYDLNAHPLLRVEKSLSSLKPELISKSSHATLRWKIPIEIEDGKNRITKVRPRPENFVVRCNGKKQLESDKRLVLKDRPKRIELEFGLQLNEAQKNRLIPGKWDLGACQMEFTMKLLVEEKLTRKRSRRRRRRRRKKRKRQKQGKVREIERIVRTHFLYPTFEKETDPKNKTAPTSFPPNSRTKSPVTKRPLPSTKTPPSTR